METKTLKSGQNIPQTSGKFYYFDQKDSLSEINSLVKKLGWKNTEYKIVKYQILRGKTLWELLNSKYKSKLPKVRKTIFVLYSNR
jgi:hypothetical protein